MTDKNEILQAIESLRMLMLPALCVSPPDKQRVYDSALQAKSGLPAIDDLLPHVDAGDDREVIEVRLFFLGHVQQAMQEPTGASGRGRKEKAAAAGKNLDAAAQSLRELGSDGLAQALDQLAALVAARAHVSVIDVSQLSSREVVPGTRLLAWHTPHQLSAYFSSKHGTGKHRAELIRFVSQRLRASTPPTLIAALLRDVMGMPCTHADVQQARGRQAQSIRESRASSDAVDLNAALRK